MWKKFFLAFCLFFFLGTVQAYTSFSANEHSQIDRQLNQKFSQLQQKEKSDFFSRLAQKSLAIRKAFLSISTKLTWAKLTKADQLFIADRIALLKRLPQSKRELALQELLKTQQLAEELSRSFQIASTSSFEGYAKTILPTPLFWLPIDNVDINWILWGKGTTWLKLDEFNLIRETAVVLPPNTPITLMKKIQTWDFIYYQVRTREFDVWRGAKFGYFIDSRFIQKEDKKPEEIIPDLLTIEDIQKNLLAASGSVYVWGGSRYQGIPEIEKFFPSAVSLSTLERKRKLLQWVDCSWLLYQATNGYTPRNTRQLLKFWEWISIEWLQVNEIIKRLKPLDLLVWDGHVVIVLDGGNTIESRGRGKNPWGVEIVSLKKRIEEIFKTRKPVNDYNTSSLSKSKKFVVRRWI